MPCSRALPFSTTSMQRQSMLTTLFRFGDELVHDTDEALTPILSPAGEPTRHLNALELIIQWVWRGSGVMSDGFFLQTYIHGESWRVGKSNLQRAHMHLAPLREMAGPPRRGVLCAALAMAAHGESEKKPKKKQIGATEAWLSQLQRRETARHAQQYPQLWILFLL